MSVSYILHALLQLLFHVSKLLFYGLGSISLGFTSSRRLGSLRFGRGILLKERGRGVERTEQGIHMHTGNHSGGETNVQCANSDRSKTELYLMRILIISFRSNLPFWLSVVELFFLSLSNTVSPFPQAFLNFIFTLIIYDTYKPFVCCNTHY